MLCTGVPLLASLLLVIAAHLTVAQQYVGSTFNNSMPQVAGSEVTFWNIADAQGNPTSLLNYQSLGADGTRLSPSNVKKVVISLHGLQQDPNTIMAGMVAALKKAHLTDDAVSQDTISIVCPLFANTAQANQAFPFTTGASPAAAGSTSRALVWTSVNWAGGFNNVYPYKQTTVSSFAVLDQMLQYFDNKTLFPSLNEIVVAGHSAGGQAINRYAAIGKDLGLTTPIRYWIANAGNWLWFNSSRPVYRDPASICSTYDAWRNGLNGSLVAYNKALSSQGSAAVLANWQSKSKIYARGLLDNGDASTDCAPYTSGQNRRERFFAQLVAFPPTVDDNVDYANVGHDAPGFFLSAGAQARFFFDNFDGNGSRSTDFGDRQQIGDSPDPNPANAAPAPVAGPGWNGTSFEGCWVDYLPSAAHILPVASNVTGHMTINRCITACYSSNYTLSGLLNGTTCLCGDSLPDEAVQVVDKGCGVACPGNSTQVCGDAERISVWSATDLNPVLLRANTSTKSTSTTSSVSATGTTVTSSTITVASSATTMASSKSTTAPKTTKSTSERRSSTSTTKKDSTTSKKTLSSSTKTTSSTRDTTSTSPKASSTSTLTSTTSKASSSTSKSSTSTSKSSTSPSKPSTSTAKLSSTMKTTSSAKMTTSSTKKTTSSTKKTTSSTKKTTSSTKKTTSSSSKKTTSSTKKLTTSSTRRTSSSAHRTTSSTHRTTSSTRKGSATTSTTRKRT